MNGNNEWVGRRYAELHRFRL